MSDKQVTSGIFRKESIDRVNSPEKLDDYIKVAKPSIWIVLIAIVLLLIGVVIWGIFGRLTVHNADGTTKQVAPITFITN